VKNGSFAQSDTFEPNISILDQNFDFTQISNLAKLFKIFSPFFNYLEK